MVDSYEDDAVGVMTKNARGKLFVSKVALRPAHRFLRRQAAERGRAGRAAPPRPRGMLHRQLGADRGGGRAGSHGRATQAGPDEMRYLPLTDADRTRHAGQDRRRRHRRPVRRHPEGQASRRPRRPAARPRARWRWSGSWPARGAERAGRLGAVLRRRRRLQAPRAGDRRPPDPALRVPHLLHALSAGDRAGHAAVPVRVPDAGGDADRHGGGQRLHVRRLHGGGRGRADGASRHQAAQGGAGRQPASALSRDHRDAWRGMAGRRDRGAAADAGGERGPGGADRRRPCPAWWCRRPTSTATCTISRRSPRRRTPPARC